MPISDRAPALAVTDLAGGYAGADSVVKSISLEVRSGEVLCIIGPNGAGKSTALKLIAGLLIRQNGTVAMAGRDVSALPAHQRARDGLVFVPQEKNVFAGLTVTENLEFGLFHGRKNFSTRLAAIFERYPVLGEARSKPAGDLSGGQRQILALAVALMSDPDVLLLDEPTAAVSPAMSAELFRTIRTIADEGLAVLMVEQNAQQALEMSDRAHIIVDGRSRKDGPADEILKDPNIRRVFLGG